MKVVLNTDLGRFGRKGDVAEVAGGYARNYLIPRNLAIQATKGALLQAEMMKKSREQHDAKQREELEVVAQKIGSLTLEIVAKAGPGGVLFGSVTNAELAGELAKALGAEVDRRKVSVAEPIKSLGRHEFRIQLHRDVVGVGTVEVTADPSTPVQPQAPEPAEPAAGADQAAPDAQVEASDSVSED